MLLSFTALIAFTITLSSYISQTTAGPDRKLLAADIPVTAKSILPSSGDGCPGPTKYSVKASSSMGRDLVSRIKIDFLHHGPHAVLSQAAISSRWCELEIELEDISNVTTPPFDPWASIGQSTAESYSSAQYPPVLEVATGLSWS